MLTYAVMQSLVTHQRMPEMISKGSKPKVQLTLKEVFGPSSEAKA